MSITDLLSPQEERHTGFTGGLVLGRVDANNDKKFPGMVKVEFKAWEQGKNISQWLPVLLSYAGKEHGKYLLPEVDDIVLVGFMGAMLEKPFVMGSFYPAGAKLPEKQFDNKNLNRHFATKGGVTFTVRDESGKQKMEAVTPKGLKISAEDEKEVITVTDKDGKNILRFDCKGGEISLSADKKISLKAGNCEITMDGNTGGLTLKCDQLKLEAGKTASIKSGNIMTVEGGMLTVQGKQQLALKGSALCEISGGVVKIN